MKGRSQEAGEMRRRRAGAREWRLSGRESGEDRRRWRSENDGRGRREIAGNGEGQAREREGE